MFLGLMINPKVCFKFIWILYFFIGMLTVSMVPENGQCIGVRWKLFPLWNFRCSLLMNSMFEEGKDEPTKKIHFLKRLKVVSSLRCVTA